MGFIFLVEKDHKIDGCKNSRHARFLLNMLILIKMIKMRIFKPGFSLQKMGLSSVSNMRGKGKQSHKKIIS
ncbi:hypothetical protein CUN67_27995 (plasmid) [Pantoea cypripedii]|uniref:Uncharacterized protein n=1 Tax=Pantoea cypripedii TaxID=55209 RepID=A0A6B9G883_PANCY|nr:hypothetical protein CUN67_27995 [Pantoea cypripedii]